MTKPKSKNKLSGIINRSVLVIITITIIAAVVIVAIFVTLAKRGKPPTAPDYGEYIESLKKQGAGSGGQDATGTGSKPEEIIVYSGRLESVSMDLDGNSLNLKDSTTGSSVRFKLTATTTIVYGARELQKSDLHAGDELQVTAQKMPDQTLAAKEVKVLVSTSPTVPTQINVPPETPGIILPPSKVNVIR